MTRIRRFAYAQGKYLLDNQKHALFCAALFALFSLTTWLSAAVVALITLRRGAKDGCILLCVAMLTDFAVTQFQIPFYLAIINALLHFVPCFLAACTLRYTASWSAVYRVLFVQVCLVVLLLQQFAPDFIMAQFTYFQVVIKEMQPEGALSEFLAHISAKDTASLANYLLGVQAAGVVMSAVLSLILARAVQSLIYYPGGFRREMLGFRGHKIELIVLIGMIVLANNANVVAINLLPASLLYFLLTGISLSFNIFVKEKPVRSFLLLIVPLIFLPVAMFFVYVIFGSLDSLFNFRSYLHKRADKSI